MTPVVMSVRFTVHSLLCCIYDFNSKCTIVLLCRRCKHSWMCRMGASAMRRPGIHEVRDDGTGEMSEMRGVPWLQHGVAKGEEGLEVVWHVRFRALQGHVPDRQSLRYVREDRRARVGAVSLRVCGCRCIFFLVCCCSSLWDSFFILVFDVGLFFLQSFYSALGLVQRDS
jgi:hypothetical protein